MQALSSGVYEKLCVLFNIAACCSEIASSVQLDQEDGLKTAAKLYQQAAGCFSYIRDNSLTATRSDCTSDFYPEALSLFISIMLAQAQEIFYIKSVKDKFKDATIAKIGLSHIKQVIIIINCKFECLICFKWLNAPTIMRTQ